MNSEASTRPAEGPESAAVAEVASRGIRFGPGLIVAAAFIGPGTVVSASQAGARFGCELLWTILFAALGAIILQSFAARVGILAGRGLGETLRARLHGTLALRPVIALVILAIGVGNAAYQTGNLTGAAAGLSSVLGGDQAVWLMSLSGLTAAILWFGEYRGLQRILIGLVCLLSFAFLATAAMCLPSPARVLSGALIPRVSSESLTLVMALIGTTIVPYNVFLHASAAAQNWRGIDRAAALRQANWDTVLSIALGGLVTGAVVLTASAAYYDQGRELTGIGAMAEQLQPTLGRASGILFGLGLFAAGLTSSLTAPLATAYAICGVLGWQTETAHATRFRAIAMTVVALGATFAIRYQAAPSATILLAQVANGILLPVIAALLVWISTRIEGEARTYPLAAGLRYAGWLVVLGVSLLAGWKLWNLL